MSLGTHPEDRRTLDTDHDHRTGLLRWIAWIQPERIRKVDRIPTRIPVGVEPTRDPDGVSLRDLSLSVS